MRIQFMLAYHGLEFVFCLRYRKIVITSLLCYKIFSLSNRCTGPQAAVSESRQMAALLVGLKTALYMMNRLKAYMDYLRAAHTIIPQVKSSNSVTGS
jgi:hypothetical protein